MKQTASIIWIQKIIVEFCEMQGILNWKHYTHNKQVFV